MQCVCESVRESVPNEQGDADVPALGEPQPQTPVIEMAADMAAQCVCISIHKLAVHKHSFRCERLLVAIS